MEKKIKRIGYVTIYLKGSIYYTYYSLNRKRYREPVGRNIKNAEVTASKLNAKIDRIKAGLEAAETLYPAISLDQFELQITEYIQTRYTLRTSDTYSQRLKAFLNYLKEIQLDINQIDNTIVEKYINYRIGKVKNQTINNDIQMLKAVFYKAQRLKLIKDNPFAGIKSLPVLEKKPFFYTKEQIQSIFKFIPNRFQPHFTVLLETGIRVGELTLLYWDDIDYANRFLNITTRRSKSKNRERYIPLTDRTIAAFQTRKKLKEHETFIFSTMDGKPLHRNTLRSVWVRAKICAGIKIGRVHDLRHTFASWLVQSGESIYLVSKLLGHSEVKMTEIYAHLAPKKSDYEILNKVFNYK